MNTTASDIAAEPQAASGLDVEALAEFMGGRWRDLRQAARKVIGQAEFHKVEGLPMPAHRERVLDQLRLLAAQGQVLRGFPVRLGGADDPGGNLAGFEELLLADPSLQVKAGVQWGLFGAAILHLGTREQQDRWLPDAMSLRVPGAFAMTETGHGSDVASLQTTATYDPETQEFVLHTPQRSAWKDYLGNAAWHATAAVVFAQLRTLGEDHGVHVFYVPIREEGMRGPGNFLAGIGGEDDGLKGGLNGIDNGRLHFDQVRVPRDHLLGRYASVAADGAYSSPIQNPKRRFFTMLGSLVQGRVSLDGAAVTAAKVGLAIAVRYSNRRRQFVGGDPHEETVLLNYATHQRRLLVPLARAYAAHFAHERLLQVFDDVFSGRVDTLRRREDLETMAAALKAANTRFAVDTLQACREACGGAGFLTVNRMTSLRADLDVYVTFEGDNTVLRQLVARRLIAGYASQFTHPSAADLARVVVDRAADLAIHRLPVKRAAQALADAGDVRRSVGHLRDVSMQRALLVDRVDTMVEEIAAALRPAQDADPQLAATLVNQHQNELVALSDAWADLLLWEAFTQAIEAAPHQLRGVLGTVRDIAGLTMVEQNIAWFIMRGRLSVQRARTITGYVDRLLERIRPDAVALVDAFGYGPEHLRAEIAFLAVR